MMMTSLFSIFDPATSSSFSLNWISMFIIFILIIPLYWIQPSNLSIILANINFYIHKEIKTTLGKNASKGSSLFFVMMFMFIVINNFMGLMPYIFTASSHMAFTLALALPFWISLIMFSWLNHFISSLAHLVPQGTPTPLMMFMVLIESVSQLIRPITLAVRLMANMIAGHLLMTLVGNMAAVSSLIAFTGVMNAFILLSTLEVAVSLIQAYVFVILLSLYANEAIDH